MSTSVPSRSHSQKSYVSDTIGITVDGSLCGRLYSDEYAVAVLLKPAFVECGSETRAFLDSHPLSTHWR